MIPDFPEEKTKLREFWNRRMQVKQQEYMGYFATIPSYHHHEGDVWVQSASAEGDNEREYEEFSAEFSISVNEAATLTPKMIDQKIGAVAEEMARQIVQRITGDIQALADAHGHSFNSAGRKLSPEIFLDVLSRINLSFDDDGNLIPPVILMHPALWEKIQDDVKAWEADPSFRSRHEEIVRRKREEWHDRQSHRKLVD